MSNEVLIQTATGKIVKITKTSVKLSLSENDGRKLCDGIKNFFRNTKPPDVKFSTDAGNIILEFTPNDGGIKVCDINGNPLVLSDGCVVSSGSTGRVFGTAKIVGEEIKLYASSVFVGRLFEIQDAPILREAKPKRRR